ncbi:MAG: hypothetical protein EBV01_14485 [Betaproteobacteria bacterium]|nr:hypothetical protein [Betaproteobacteria bacterium]
MQLLAISGDFQDPRACHSFATVFLKAQAQRGHPIGWTVGIKDRKTTLDLSLIKAVLPNYFVDHKDD